MGRSSKRKHGIMKLDQLDAKWVECFSKIHKLSPVDNNQPLSNEEIKQYFDNFQSMKDELNVAKCLLNNIDIVKWHRHTKYMHLCGQIVSILSQHVNAELVTQAWTKFYTILNTFDLFKNINLRNVNTVHLCEAPGSFVTSLNHFFKSHYGDKILWNWSATTLNPYYEGNNVYQMIDDDRFIIETLPHWDFGPEFTGDIMNTENLNDMEEKFKDISVTLVTADGSMDCSGNPGEQENLVGLLLLWEIITAVRVLSDGGSFVLKMFTLFEKFTISLVYFLHTLFQSVTFIKPGPSKPGNSEVYVVCEVFSKENCLKSQLFKIFVDAAMNNKMLEADIFDKIPKTFVNDIMKYVEIFTVRQIHEIKKNLETFKNNNHLIPREELKEIKDYIAKRFLKEFSVYPIKDVVAPSFVMKMKHGLFYDRSTASNFKRGSYNERIQKNEEQETCIDLQKVIDNNKEGILLGTFTDITEDLHKITITPDHTCCFESINNFKFILGKKNMVINSSCFISSALLKYYFESQHKYEEILKQTSEITSSYDTKISYHFELGKIAQGFPTIELFKNKSMLFISDSSDATQLVNYFNEKDIYANHITPVFNLHGNDIVNKTIFESNICDGVKYDLITCDLGSIDIIPKQKNMKIMLELLSHLRSSQTLLIRVEGLVFSNFWNGILFLISSLFTKMTFIRSNWSRDLYYIIYFDCNATPESVDNIQVCLHRLHDALLQLGNDMDIFHVIDIYSLMQSNYRKYMVSRNECFAQGFINIVSKLF